MYTPPSKNTYAQNNAENEKKVPKNAKKMWEEERKCENVKKSAKTVKHKKMYKPLSKNTRTQEQCQKKYEIRGKMPKMKNARRCDSRQ